MNRTLFLCLLYFVVVCISGGTAGAQQQQIVTLPAGTLLNCTLNEPNLSPTTASIDDPVLCYLDSLQQVGRSLPRGSYLGGRLVGARQPGRFVGKGSMTLVFDRIGLGNSLLPLPGKVIAVHGYRVTREETIKGHGHAKRDAIEWMIPILWPWKVLALPARGPQPTMKGEVRLTLRLMDDLLPLGEAASSTLSSAPPMYQGRAIGASFMGAVSSRMQPVATADFRSSGKVTTPHLTLLALRAGMIYAVSDYWLHDDIRLAFTPTNSVTQVIDLRELDWNMTTKLNEERGVHVMIRRGELLTH